MNFSFFLKEQGQKYYLGGGEVGVGVFFVEN